MDKDRRERRDGLFDLFGSKDDGFWTAVVQSKVSTSCKCGASLHYTGDPTVVKEALAQFRDDHKDCLKPRGRY